MTNDDVMPIIPSELERRSKSKEGVNLLDILRAVHQGLVDMQAGLNRINGKETICRVVIDPKNHSVSYAGHVQQYLPNKLSWMFFRVCAINDGECSIDTLGQTKDQLNRKLVKINAIWVKKTKHKLLRMRGNSVVIDPLMATKLTKKRRGSKG